MFVIVNTIADINPPLLGGGRARNSHTFVCLFTLDYTQEVYKAKIQAITLTHFRSSDGGDIDRFKLEMKMRQ